MVYFLDELERKEVERLVRKLDIDDEYRGWNYKEGPLKPIYNIQLPMYIITSDITFSSRAEYDEYLVSNRKSPSKEMVIGLLLHNAVKNVIEASRYFIYRYGTLSGNELYDYLINTKERYISLVDTIGYECIEYVNRLWFYEALQISSSLDRVISRGLYDKEGVLHKTLPFTLEYEINGSNVGMSNNIRADALGYSMIIFELKTGRKSERHKLTTTGYAIALESILEHPINVGCIVYCSFNGKSTPIIQREVHAIDEPLRRWFIEERDKKSEMITQL